MTGIREVKRVEFKSRPDLVLYVRSLNFHEAIELGAKLRGISDSKENIAEQLAAFVCDERGEPKFADAAAATAFMITLRQGVGTKLINEAVAFNRLGDEAIEDELKN